MDILGLLRRYYGFVTCGVLRWYRGLFYRHSGCLWLRSGYGFRNLEYGNSDKLTLDGEGFGLSSHPKPGILKRLKVE